MIPADQLPQWPDGLPISTNDLFAMMAERSYSSTIVTDRDYRILWANASFTRMTGYTLEEARGRNPADFLRCPEADPAAGEEIRAAIAAGRNFHVTLSNRRKDGSRYWINVDGQPARAPGGELVAYVVVGTDVTAQIEHEAALQRKEALLNETQRIARIGSWEYDVDTGNCFWSAETYRIYGLPVSDRAPNVSEGIAGYIEAHRPVVETAFNQCLRMGVPYDIEIILRQPGGRELWVRTIGHAETHNDRVVRVSGALQDIDERKRAELEVARLADRMALATRSAGIGIWEYVFSTNTLVWDDAMLRLYGLAAHEFTGDLRQWESIVHPEDRAQARAAFDRAVNGLGEFDTEFRIQPAGGTLRHIKGNIRIIQDPSGRPLRAYGVNYDITRERAGEQELRTSRQNLLRLNTDLQAAIEVAQRLARDAETANQAKSAFLATISHEIRTPLNGIIGMTHILGGTPLSSEQRDYLNTLKLSGETLLALINDTLDYSKIEAGRVELTRMPFSLASCVAEAIGLIEPHARQKNLALTRVIAADIPRLLEGDASRLRQIFVNLLGNAVKFTERGGAHLEVRTEAVAADEVSLAITVRDTGIGIPKDKQSRLFEHFFQVDTTATRNYGGTGLGLAISRRLLQLMGGSISVESEPGVGSTFTLRLQLPVVIEDDLIHLPACHARLAKRRALVIAPAPLGPRIETAARAAGLDVVTAASADKAFELLARDSVFDIAVSGLKLQALDGLEFARRLQTAGLRPIPLLPMERVGPLDKANTPRFHQLLASLVDPQSAAAAAAAAAAASAPPNLAATMPLSILMAEDNAVNQRVALLTLKRLGYQAEVTGNGAEALAALEKRDFDVILMDVQMPVMDGLEATRRIRAQTEHQSRPWIIALTAGAFEEDRINAFQAGMNDFLNKPLRMDLLQNALSQAWQALQTLETDKNPPLRAN
ncbi:MAG TPA: PAS domain-containing protein [Rariglobus sp.]|nr:PAS domain-containing protein [Rariglobus sp.]